METMRPLFVPGMALATSWRWRGVLVAIGRPARPVPPPPERLTGMRRQAALTPG